MSQSQWTAVMRLPGRCLAKAEQTLRATVWRAEGICFWSLWMKQLMNSEAQYPKARETLPVSITRNEC